MSTLLAEDLDITLFQEITVTKPQIVRALRPHLFIHDSPTGSLRMDIYDSSNTTLLASSEELTIADIKSQASITDTYFHGYVRFFIDWGLSTGEVVNVRLEGVSGYSFTNTDYIGWCRDFDLRKYEATYIPNTSLGSAFDFEIWDYEDNVRDV